jgi:hypothetical protein
LDGRLKIETISPSYITRSIAMPSSKSRSLIFGSTVIGLAIGASGVAIGQQWGMSGPGSQLGMPQYMKGAPTGLAELQNGDAVFVENGTFKLHLGKGETPPAKMGAKEVAHGAIIFRSDDKLYIVDWKKGE